MVCVSELVSLGLGTTSLALRPYTMTSTLSTLQSSWGWLLDSCSTVYVQPGMSIIRGGYLVEVSGRSPRFIGTNAAPGLSSYLFVRHLGSAFLIRLYIL